MKKLFRMGAAGAALALALVAGLGTAASAATPDQNGSYTLFASGQALYVALAGTQLAGASSWASAALNSDGTVPATWPGSENSCGKDSLGNAEACPTSGYAQSEGAATLLTALNGKATATSTASDLSNGTSETAAQNCSAANIPAAPLLTLQVSCGSATAGYNSSDFVNATATGDVVNLTVLPLGGIASSLGTLLPTGSSTGGLTSGLTGLLGPLTGLTSALPVGTTLTSLVTGIVNQIVGTVSNAAAGANFYLAQILVGDSNSTVSSNATTATASTTNSSVVVNVLGGVGGPLLSGDPLLQIRLTPGDAQSTLTRATGVASSTTSPGLLQITLNPPTGIGEESFTVPAGTCLGSGATAAVSALLTLCLANGTTDATGGATTNGLSLQVLPSENVASLELSNGGVASSGVAPATPTPAVATPAAATVVTPTPPAPAVAAVPGVTEVHTGLPWSGPLPLAVVGTSMLAGLGLVARRRLVSLAHHFTHLGSHVAGGPPPGPASGTSSVPPPVSGPARRQPGA
jgi:hypothetical protein